MVRVRIAPSPTGDPHVVPLHRALQLCLRQELGGQFVLRIEDTDRTRSKPSGGDDPRRLKWLGLNGTRARTVAARTALSAERAWQIYVEHCEHARRARRRLPLLLHGGAAAQVRDEQRKAKVAMPGYDGFCRKLGQAEIKAKLADRVPFVVRSPCR